LAGTNVEKGQELLRSSGIKYEEATSLQDAATKAVTILNKGLN
jgi:succinyl-CoA synthetase beta subunit